MKHSICFVLLIVISFFSIPCFADNGVDIQHWKRTNSFGFELSESARPMNSLYPNIQSWQLNLGFSYVDEPLVFKNKDNDDRVIFEPAINNFKTIHFGLKIFMTSQFYLGVTGGYVFADNNDEFWGSSPSASAFNNNWSFVDEDYSGFEDIELQLGYHLIENANWGLSLIGELDFPTGDVDAFLSDGGIGVGGVIAFERYFEWVQFAINLGYRFNKSAEIPSQSIDYRHRVNTTISALWKIYKNKLQLSTEYRRYWMLPISSCLLYTSPSPRDATLSRMPSSA